MFICVLCVHLFICVSVGYVKNVTKRYWPDSSFTLTVVFMLTFIFCLRYIFLGNGICFPCSGSRVALVPGQAQCGVCSAGLYAVNGV